MKGNGRSRRAAYTYQVNLQGGKTYIGMAHSTESLKKRIDAQLSQSPSASSVCRHARPVSVTKVWRHANIAAAKQAETRRYYSTKALLGAKNVRGAGNTKRF